MELIDKTEVVAEIKKRIKEIDEIGTYLSPKGVLTNLLCHLDTIEVKKVDLEKEYKEFINCDNGRSMFETAKYFFELGIKAKGE